MTGKEGQGQAKGEENGTQNPGRAGQKVARAARRHEARRPAAHAQSPAFGLLQQDDAAKGDTDDDQNRKQDAEQHGIKRFRFRNDKGA